MGCAAGLVVGTLLTLAVLVRASGDPAPDAAQPAPWFDPLLIAGWLLAPIGTALLVTWWRMRRPS